MKMKQRGAYYPVVASLLASVACLVARALLGGVSLSLGLSLVLVVIAIIILGLKVSPLT